MGVKVLRVAVLEVGLWWFSWLILSSLRRISLWRVALSLHWGVVPVILALVIAAAIVKVSVVAEITKTAIIVPMLVHVVWLIGVAIGLDTILVFRIVTCRVKGTPLCCTMDGFLPTAV